MLPLPLPRLRIAASLIIRPRSSNPALGIERAKALRNLGVVGPPRDPPLPVPNTQPLPAPLDVPPNDETPSPAVQRPGQIRRCEAGAGSRKVAQPILFPFLLHQVAFSGAIRAHVAVRDRGGAGLQWRRSGVELHKTFPTRGGALHSRLRGPSSSMNSAHPPSLAIGLAGRTGTVCVAHWPAMGKIPAAVGPTFPLWGSDASQEC